MKIDIILEVLQFEVKKITNTVADHVKLKALFEKLFEKESLEN